VDTTAWRVVAEHEGATMRHAIEAHAGKPGDPGALVGAFKAPPKRSWIGGEVYEAPPEPKVERKLFED